MYYGRLHPEVQPNAANISAHWTAIQTLAPDRFDRFRRAHDADELDAVARYLWNMALCRSIQTPLHVLEVTFRNQLHNALRTLRSRSDWYDDSTLMNSREQKMVLGAKSQLTNLGRPHDPGRVVAELTFGFWTSLYGVHHDLDIIRPTFNSVFQHLPAGVPARRQAATARLRDTRIIRNRVSHHEPIYSMPNLIATHTHICELVAWMSPQMSALIDVDDNFRKLFGAGWTGYRPVLEELFG
jgi:hypothetical protein